MLKIKTQDVSFPATYKENDFSVSDGEHSLGRICSISLLSWVVVYSVSYIEEISELFLGSGLFWSSENLSLLTFWDYVQCDTELRTFVISNFITDLDFAVNILYCNRRGTKVSMKTNF